MCTVFIVSAFIDHENCPGRVKKIVSGPHQNRKYIFASLAGLWKVVERVTVFVILPVVINKFIGFKPVPQVVQVCSCVGKCRTKGKQDPLGYYLGKRLCNILRFYFYFHVFEEWFVFIVGPSGTKAHSVHPLK